MKSFYIEQTGERLYCNLHAPKARLIRDTGVLLCAPVGHEYYRTYRAFSRLAEQLAENGYTVLRFDYLGTGESGGPTGHTRLNDWANDVRRAAAQLMGADGVNSIALIGMRFGAVAAAMAARNLAGAKALILWEPALPGDDYVAGLAELHELLLKDLERFPHRRDTRESVVSEYLGYVYGQPLLEDLCQLDPNELIPDNLQTVLLSNPGEDVRCARVLDAAGKCVKRHRLSHEGYGWREIRRVSETVVDPAANRQLTTILDEIAV